MCVLIELILIFLNFFLMNLLIAIINMYDRDVYWEQWNNINE